MLAFQVADLTIFILALALILQAIVVFSQLRKHNNVADRTELITAQDIVDSIQPPAGTPPTAAPTQLTVSKWLPWSTRTIGVFEKEVVERRLLRHLFLRRFGLPQLFPFSKYLRRAQANQISHMIEVEPSMWILLLFVAWLICGFCTVYDLDQIYGDFGLLPALMHLRVDATTLGEVVNHFSEIVELRSEFASSLLECLKQEEATILDLRAELHAHDLQQTGVVDVDKLRKILASFGYRLTRFRFNSVAMLLFDLSGTRVEYGQLLRLLTLAQHEPSSESGP
eukprot:jgi/Phyca11/14721/fgenesh1_pg.PHYCAscaffold_9_\